MSAEDIPVVLFACNRPAYLRQALDVLFANPDIRDRRVFVSQDGHDAEVDAVIRSYGSRINHLRFTAPVRRLPLSGDATKDAAEAKYFGKWQVYYRISQHYGWALEELFDQQGLERLIILEDDIEIGPDFFNFLESAAALIDADSTIWSVSAWNDHSYHGRVVDRERLLRTDFFPGLGWLMTRKMWEEVQSEWPVMHWDQWLRLPQQRKGRSIIIPEFSRTRNIGRIGTAGTEFFDERLADLAVNTEPVDFTQIDLSYLHKPAYDAALREAVAGALPVEPGQLSSHPGADIKILYHSSGSFDALADSLGLMPSSLDAGLPRVSCNGVVSCREGDRTIYLVPLTYITGDAGAEKLAVRL